MVYKILVQRLKGSAQCFCCIQPKFRTNHPWTASMSLARKTHYPSQRQSHCYATGGRIRFLIDIHVPLHRHQSVTHILPVLAVQYLPTKALGRNQLKAESLPFRMMVVGSPQLCEPFTCYCWLHHASSSYTVPLGTYRTYRTRALANGSSAPRSHV